MSGKKQYDKKDTPPSIKPGSLLTKSQKNRLRKRNAMRRAIEQAMHQGEELDQTPPDKKALEAVERAKEAAAKSPTPTELIKILTDNANKSQSMLNSLRAEEASQNAITKGDREIIQKKRISFFGYAMIGILCVAAIAVSIIFPLAPVIAGSAILATSVVATTFFSNAFKTSLSATAHEKSMTKRDNDRKLLNKLRQLAIIEQSMQDLLTKVDFKVSKEFFDSIGGRRFISLAYNKEFDDFFHADKLPITELSLGLPALLKLFSANVSETEKAAFIAGQRIKDENATIFNIEESLRLLKVPFEIRKERELDQYIKMRGIFLKTIIRCTQENAFDVDSFARILDDELEHEKNFDCRKFVAEMPNILADMAHQLKVAEINRNNSISHPTTSPSKVVGKSGGRASPT